MQQQHTRESAGERNEIVCTYKTGRLILLLCGARDYRPAPLGSRPAAKRASPVEMFADLGPHRRDSARGARWLQHRWRILRVDARGTKKPPSPATSRSGGPLLRSPELQAEATCHQFATKCPAAGRWCHTAVTAQWLRQGRRRPSEPIHDDPAPRGVGGCTAGAQTLLLTALHRLTLFWGLKAVAQRWLRRDKQRRL